MSVMAGMKVDLFTRVFVEEFLVALIMRGKDKVHLVRSVSEAFEEAFADIENLEKPAAEFVDLAARVKTLCYSVRILLDATPMSLVDCPVDMKLVRQMVTSDQVDEPWTLFGDALEGSTFWQPLRKDFRRAAWTELTIGKEMKETAESLAAGDPGAAISLVQQLPSWISRCRAGGCSSGAPWGP
jgi:hypothetical protein